jgi:hypothetical protein
MAHSALYGIWRKGSGEQWWRFGMSVSEFENLDAQHFNKGLHLRDLTVRDDEYTAVWRPGNGSQHWQSGMSQDEFKSKDDARFADGYRLHSLSVDDDNYTAVWRPGTGEQRWVANTTLDNFKTMDTQWFNHGLRIHYISVDDEHVTCVWRPGSGEQHCIYNADLSTIMANDAAFFKKGLVMKKLAVDDAGLTNTGGKWAAVWRPGSGGLHWVSALPTDFENFDASLFTKGYRLTTCGEWDAGGIDFDLGDFLDSLFKGVTVSDQSPDGDPGGGDDGE